MVTKRVSPGSTNPNDCPVLQVCVLPSAPIRGSSESRNVYPHEPRHIRRADSDLFFSPIQSNHSGESNSGSWIVATTDETRHTSSRWPPKCDIDTAARPTTITSTPTLSRLFLFIVLGCYIHEEDAASVRTFGDLSNPFLFRHVLGIYLPPLPRTVYPLRNRCLIFPK